MSKPMPAPILRPRHIFFWRLGWRSMSLKRPQAWLAIGSILIGAAAASTLLNLYTDVQRKMTQEFRAYGANVVLAPKATGTVGSAENELISESALSRLRAVLAPTRGVAAVPELYVAVRVRRVPPDPRLAEFENLVAVGTDFEQLRRLYPGWRVAVPSANLAAEDCALGSRLASRLRAAVGDFVEVDLIPGATDGGRKEESGISHPPGSNPIDAAEPGQSRHRQYRIANVVTVGGPEDDQLFISLAGLQQLAGLEGKASLIQLSVPGDAGDIERTIQEVSKALPELDVRPIRQIVYSEGRVLEKIRGLLLALTGLILVVILLSIAATTTAIVLERRNDIAVMKALGASNRFLTQLFMSESAGLGLIGGLAGCVLGIVLAHRLGLRLFGVSLGIVVWTVPAVVAGSMLVALVATLSVVRIIRGVRPAVVLRGE
jgi:putative ABC transport system permease protein